MAEYIREVEKIIDDFHKRSPVFSLNRKTVLYHAFIVSAVVVARCICNSMESFREVITELYG